MHRVLPNFRTPDTIAANRAFLDSHPQKSAVLNMLAAGLRGNWGVKLPPPNRPAANYLGPMSARRKCRLRLKSEILAGRMIGAPGWTRETVRWFLRGDFYVTPCGAVAKGNDPHGRILHNSSNQFYGNSLNDALLDNLVSHIAFKDRVACS